MQLTSQNIRNATAGCLGSCFACHSPVAFVGLAQGVGNPVQVFVPYANASTTNETAKYLDSHLVHTGQFFSTDAMNTHVRPPPLPTASLQMCVYAVCVPKITQIHCLPGTVPLCCSVCPTNTYSHCFSQVHMLQFLPSHASLSCRVHEATLQAARLLHKDS